MSYRHDDIDLRGRMAIDATRDYNMDREHDLQDQTFEAHRKRIAEIHKTECSKAQISGINHANIITGDVEGLTDEMIEILKGNPDDVSRAEKDGWECPETEDYWPMADRAEDWLTATSKNVAHCRRYRTVRPETSMPAYTPALQAHATDRGADLRTGEVGAPDYRTKLDPEGWKRHVVTTTKARRYHGIEALVLDSRGRVRGGKSGKTRRKSRFAGC